jgi:hypothetical protein
MIVVESRYEERMDDVKHDTDIQEINKHCDDDDDREYRERRLSIIQDGCVLCDQKAR